jgi:hypothetical protein
MPQLSDVLIITLTLHDLLELPSEDLLSEERLSHRYLSAVTISAEHYYLPATPQLSSSMTRTCATPNVVIHFSSSSAEENEQLYR